MNIKKLSMGDTDFPVLLTEIPDPPKSLYVLGETFGDLLQKPRLAVVGSRKVSTYGRSVTALLTEEVARQGIVIVSGLALGLDGLAHQAALNVNAPTIAVLPCGLDHIYPSSHYGLAKKILQKGGAIVSEYPEDTVPFKTNFLARNRIISGLSEGVLIPEAAERSGSLSTANHALEQGREVMAVPGNITSQLSTGTNNLIKIGATPITTAQDILQALGLEQKEQFEREIIGATAEEHAILTLIQQGLSDGDALQQQSGLSAATFGQTLTMLEITGKIRPLGANRWHLP
jgi:DNA processing protein